MNRSIISHKMAWMKGLVIRGRSVQAQQRIINTIYREVCVSWVWRQTVPGCPQVLVFREELAETARYLQSTVCQITTHLLQLRSMIFSSCALLSYFNSNQYIYLIDFNFFLVLVASKDTNIYYWTIDISQIEWFDTVSIYYKFVLNSFVLKHA